MECYHSSLDRIAICRTDFLSLPNNRHTVQIVHSLNQLWILNVLWQHLCLLQALTLRHTTIKLDISHTSQGACNWGLVGADLVGACTQDLPRGFI